MVAGVDRIYLCGRLVVEIGGERVEARLPGRQGRLLLAFLVLTRRRAVPRPKLIDAVWSEGVPGDPDGALSALLSKLRSVLGDGAVEGRSEIQLTLPREPWVDIEAAEEALHRAESAVALGQWRDAWAPAGVAVHVAARGFLAGYDSQWIVEKRAEVDNLFLRGLEAYAEASLGIGGTELATAERSARSLVKHAPLRESGHRFLMRWAEARGNLSDALRIYEDLRTLLNDELGVGPGPETRALHSEIAARCG